MYISDCLAYQRIQTSVEKLTSEQKDIVAIRFATDASNNLVSLSLSHQQAGELASRLLRYFALEASQAKREGVNKHASHFVSMPRWAKDNHFGLS